MAEAQVILPNDEFFPDSYDGSSEAAHLLFNRICTYMQVDPGGIELDLFPDETEELREILPNWSGGSSGCAAGLYYHPDGRPNEDHRAVIALKESLLRDPSTLIATIAHELGHAILLGGKLIESDTQDHEPLTDLLTVFLGLGIFTSNACARFQQFTEPRRQGWSMQRLGYLGQAMYGYALAKFACERGESAPDWSRHLSVNVKAYFKRSSAWLARNA